VRGVPHVLAQLTERCRALPLHVTGVKHSAQFFKTVFLQIEPSVALRTLQRQLLAALDNPDAYAFEPHLSLIYKTLSAATRAQIASMAAAPSSFACDELRVVVPSEHGWDDVLGWRVLYAQPLAGP
jgi:hypothetical protein